MPPATPVGQSDPCQTLSKGIEQLTGAAGAAPGGSIRGHRSLPIAAEPLKSLVMYRFHECVVPHLGPLGLDLVAISSRERRSPGLIRGKCQPAPYGSHPMRRVLLLVISAFVVACTGAGEPTTTAPPTSLAPSATSTPGARPSIVIGGLILADPATLIPVENAAPIVTAGWHSGVVSPNRFWAAVRSGDDDEASRSISIVDLQTMSIVAAAEGFGEGLTIGDAGVAYYFESGELNQLGPDTAGPVPGGPPLTPTYLASTLEILPDGRLAYLTGVEDQLGPVSIVVIEDGVTVHEIGTVTSGPVPAGDPTVPHRDFLVPEVAWDHRRDRALVISAAEDMLVVTDLVSGNMTEHGFAAGGSPGDGGAGRDAFLSNDGSTLFVATRLLEVTSDGGDWEAVDAGQQLAVVDTSDWTIRLVPVDAWALAPAPDGGLLATVGAEITSNGAGTSTTRQSPVYLVDTVTGEPLVGFEGRSGTIVDVQFSAAGAEMYVRSFDETTTIDIVDIATRELVGSVGYTRISLIGEAGLMAFHTEP